MLVSPTAAYVITLDGGMRESASRDHEARTPWNTDWITYQFCKCTSTRVATENSGSVSVVRAYKKHVDEKQTTDIHDAIYS